MLRTYKAVLRGDRIEWLDAAPEAVSPTPVHVTLLEDSAPMMQHGAAMAAALEGLATSGAFSQIGEPIAWQREVRQDRPLPDHAS